MLEREELDAVFIVTGPDEHGRPRYPALAIDCLEADGTSGWRSRPLPPAPRSNASRDAATATGIVMVG